MVGNIHFEAAGFEKIMTEASEAMTRIEDELCHMNENMLSLQSHWKGDASCEYMEIYFMEFELFRENLKEICETVAYLEEMASELMQIQKDIGFLIKKI